MRPLDQLPAEVSQAATDTFRNWLAETFSQVADISVEDAQQQIGDIEVISHTCGLKVNVWAHVSPELHELANDGEYEEVFGTTAIPFQDPRKGKRTEWSIGERDYDLIK